MLRLTGLTTMYFTLSQRRLRWLGHVLRMGDERIPKSMLYSELVDGTRKCSRPTLRFKDVCKRHLKSLMAALISWSLLMTATNGDLLNTTVLKKETNNSLRDPSRRRIYSRMSFVYHLFIFCCITVFVLLYFSLISVQVFVYYFSFLWAQSRIADSGWQRAYSYIL